MKQLTYQYIVISVYVMITLISYSHNYSTDKTQCFLGIQSSQSDNTVNHNTTIISTSDLNDNSQPFKTAIINQSNSITNTNDNDIDALQTEITSILDNIKLLGSELITTSQSTKEILKEINELQTDFSKMQFEITTDSNQQHKKISIINDRLSNHLKDQLNHQLFLINKTEDDLILKNNEAQAELTTLKFDIYLNSKCASYQTCSQCATDSSCGWCISSNKCIEGDMNKPFFSQCDSYSYSICDKEALCSHSTCNECIANSLCAWCANSPKPYCTKVTENNMCDSDMTISLLGTNPICPMVNYKLKYEGGYQTDFLKENMNMEKRKQLKEKYDLISRGIESNKEKLEEYKKKREMIGRQIEMISQQREDFDMVEEDVNQKGFSDEFRKKMMNVFKTELQTFLENLKKVIAKQ